jgi:hypothetical protein
MQRARFCVCLGVALALLPASIAQADIAPVPTPDGPVAPLIKPTAPKPAPQHVTQQPSSQQGPVVAQTPVGTTSQTTVRTSPPPPVSASGGRRQPAVAPVTATGGRLASASLPAIVELFPTKLAEVGNDSLPAYGSWPSWVLGAFTLLASVEAFLLVRIARARRYAQGERLRELADH